MFSENTADVSTVAEVEAPGPFILILAVECTSGCPREERMRNGPREDAPGPAGPPLTAVPGLLLWEGAPVRPPATGSAC